MDKEKAERIIKIVNWVRYIILAVFLTFVFVALSKAQTTYDFGVWAAYEFHLKKQTTGSETISLAHHQFMADVVPSVSVSSWLKLSLRERY